MPKYEIINHGYDHSQYFQGCGTHGTPFLFCVTGAGDNARAAYEDAVEQVYSSALSYEEVLALHLPKRPHGIRKRDHVPARLLREENNEIYWYVSIRF